MQLSIEHLLRRARPDDGRLTILSSGLGRDSSTMVCLLLGGKLLAEGRPLRPSDVDAVVFSDTGMEWPFTYRLGERTRRLLAKAGVPFYVLAKPPARDWRPYSRGLRERYEAIRAAIAKARRSGDERLASHLEHRSQHPASHDPVFEAATGQPAQVPPAPWLERTWPSIAAKAAGGGYHHRAPLLPSFAERRRIPMRAKHECTLHHKIRPIQSFAADLAAERFGVPSNRAWAAEVTAGRRPPHRMLIGIAADEASRATPSEEPAFVKVFPLIEMGISKMDEEPILRRCGFEDARKSGCWTCMYQPISWFWALREVYPDLYAEVVETERRALERNPSFYLKGSEPVDVQVRRWRANNPDATVDSVLDKDYKRCGGGV
jgi:hypothetical protein